MSHAAIIASIIGAWLLAAPVGAQILRVPPYRTVAELGACVDGKPKLVAVTDGATESDCSTGGGTIEVPCFCLDGAWQAGGTGAQGPAGPAGPQGATGPQGPAGADGEDGAQGAPGAAATVAVGSTTTGSAGSSASVSNSGTSAAAVLDFTIPRGDTGATGSTGPTGATGATGPTGPAGPIAGSDTQVAFNDGGAAAGDAGLTYLKSTDALVVAGSVQAGNVRATGNTLSTTNTNGNLLIQPNGTGAIHLYSSTSSGFSLYFQASQILGLKKADDSGYLFLNAERYRAIGGNAIASQLSNFGVDLKSDTCLGWAGNTSDATQAKDVAICRDSAGVAKISDGSSGAASLKLAKAITAAQAFTVADNGNGATRASSTLTPGTSYVAVTCSDPQGCDITLSETGAADGQALRAVCVTANLCGFADTSGVSELAGSVDLGLWDTLNLTYVVDRWVETGRSNN